MAVAIFTELRGLSLAERPLLTPHTQSYGDRPRIAHDDDDAGDFLEVSHKSGGRPSSTLGTAQ